MHTANSLPDETLDQIEEGLLAVLLRQELQRKKRYVYGDLVQNPKSVIKAKKHLAWEEMADKL